MKPPLTQEKTEKLPSKVILRIQLVESVAHDIPFSFPFPFRKRRSYLRWSQQVYTTVAGDSPARLILSDIALPKGCLCSTDMVSPVV